MKRTSARPNTLKHLPFFEVLANAPEGSPEANLATAGLLTLRMIDHWVLAGPPIVEPESVSVRSVRNAIMALPPKEPVRESLLTIVNTMQMLRHVDLIPVLPRVFAYGQLLEKHQGAIALAADAYESIVRLSDPEMDAEVSMDAYQRLSFCQRSTGALSEAAVTSQALIKLARRNKDRARALRGKIGLAMVSYARGELADADSQFVEIASEAQRAELSREFALATHGRSVVAYRGGNTIQATVLAHQALKFTTDVVERDRVLNDLAAYLIKLEQFDAALDACRVLELTATSDQPRVAARCNIVVAAARSGNRMLFESSRHEIEHVEMPVISRVSLDIEIGRGLRAFGDPTEGDRFIDRAEDLARSHSLDWAIDEISRLRESRIVQFGIASADAEAQTREVAATLKSMVAAVAA